MQIKLAELPADPVERVRVIETQMRQDLDRAREQQTEIQMLLQQTSIEVDKLTQREQSIMTRIRDMEINLENYSRSDIKTLYTASHETNLRLFMMRGQVEALQARQQHVKERQEQLGIILSVLNSQDFASLEPAGQDEPEAPAPEQVAASASLRRLMEVQESERLRISRYLHDGPAQTLANLVLRAEICEHLILRDTNEARAELQGLRSNLTGSLQETRRLIFDLRPMILDDIGLAPTLRRYLTDVSRERGFAATVRGPETADPLTPPARAMLFRLVQDAVSEMARRDSLAQVSVDITSSGAEVELTLEARGADSAGMPALEEVMATDEMRQRLSMLVATSQVSAAGERSMRLVVRATPPVN